MTISDTKLRKALIAAMLCVLLVPTALSAQAQAPATTAGRQAVQQLRVLPTGPMTATSKAAASIRAARAAQLDAARGAATGAAASARSTSVVGYLWTANNSVVTDATVQLRNTVTGQIEMFTQTNSLGEFTFNNVVGGSYVIEYASEQAGSLLAVGHPFTVAPGQTLATFVRMSNALPIIIPDFARNVAAAALQAAASSGVTTVLTPLSPVVDPPPPPASPIR